MEDFNFNIVSPFDREKLTCEIEYKGEIIAEISQETEELLIEIYRPQINEWWTLPLSSFQKALEDAKKHLIDG